MKKITILLLVLCLIAGSLSGCSFKQISTEDDITSELIGGFLYDTTTRPDNREERTYIKERKKAVSSLVTAAMKAANLSFSINDGISDYETNLLKYINKTDDLSDEDSAIIIDTMEILTAYRIALSTYEEEIKSYSKMKPKTGASDAIIDSYAVTVAYNLNEMQNQCLSFLTNRTSLIKIILEKTNQRQSEKLLSSSISLFNKKISGQFTESQNELEKATAILTYINSADYYASDYYFTETAAGIEKIKAGTVAEGTTLEMISDIEKLYSDLRALSGKPTYLVPVPIDTSSSLFIGNVLAASEEEDPMGDATKTLKAVPDIETKTENAPLLFGQNIQDSVEKNKKSTNISNDSSYTTPENKGKSLWSFFTNKVSDTAEKVKDKAEEAGIKIIILLAQNSISKFNKDTDSRYAAIIKTLVGHIAGSKSVQETNQTEAVTNLINKDLELLIGENKEAFVSFILTTSASTLLETFNDWKEGMNGDGNHIYTIKDMISLLTLIGIDAAEIPVDLGPVNSGDGDKTTASQPSQNTNTSSPSDTAQNSDTNIPVYTDSTLFNHTEIIASYDQMIRISSEETNERILEMIYGWTDPLVYSNYNKITENDEAKDIVRTYYTDSEDNPIGWDLKVSESRNNLQYEYHFPQEDSKYVRITRKGTLESSILFQITTNDTDTGRYTKVILRSPDAPESDKYGVIVEEGYAGVKNGINTDSYMNTEGYDIWSEGKPIDAYSFKDNVLHIQVHWEYSGEDEFRTKTWYYGIDKINKIEHYKNKLKHGVFLVYSEDDKLMSKVEYKNDEFHGTVESFYKSGHPKTTRTYENGIKNGLHIDYYDNESEQIETTGYVKNNIMDGAWYDYDETGKLKSEKTYKKAVLHGPYILNDLRSDYYKNGQYTDGKETGIWEHGSSAGWHYKVEYDATGNKVWENNISNTFITYFNPDGSVNRNEPKN